MRILKFIWKLIFSLIKFILKVIIWIFYIPVWIFSKILKLLGYDLRNTQRQLKIIDEMTGREFEEYCVKLLKKNGFYQVHLTQESQDYGIDIIAIYKDEIFAIQCKKYSSTLGNFSVQEAFTGKNYYIATKAAVLTNSKFSKNAIKLAESNTVFLWDREILVEMIENKFNIDEEDLKD